MKNININKLILVTALEADLQGMIAENKDREQSNLAMAYTGADFADIAE